MAEDGIEVLIIKLSLVAPSPSIGCHQGEAPGKKSLLQAVVEARLQQLEGHEEGQPGEVGEHNTQQAQGDANTTEDFHTYPKNF